MNNGIVIGIGEILWDMLPDGKKLGGAPANFAYHVAQFGLDSCVVSAIGQDESGAEIEKSLAAKGLKRQLESVPYPTGTVEVAVDAAGIPQYQIKEDVAWDHIPYTSSLEALARSAKAVCFGSLAQRSSVSRASIQRFLKAVPSENEPLLIFDINLRQHFYEPSTLIRSLELCNILKINDEELAAISQMFGCPEQEQQAQCQWFLRKFGLRMLILTCGTAGSSVFTAESVSTQATPRVKVADTVGAGDSFTAAFVASLLKGKSIAEAHRTAVAVSAYVCTQYGAMPQLPPQYLR